MDLFRRGLMLVLSSPSGAGKTTVCRRLLSEESEMSMSVSVQQVILSLKYMILQNMKLTHGREMECWSIQVVEEICMKMMR